MVAMYEHDEDRLHAYYDGELPAPERAEVEAHLKGCAPCRQALSRWRRIAGTLLEAPLVRPSDSFVAAVMKEVDRFESPVPQRAAWLPGWLVPSLALAGAVLTFYVSLPASTVSTDPKEWLLADNGTQLAMVLGDEEPRAGDILGLALER